MVTPTAHVLVFPFPAQGHINSMLHFATALVGAGVHVTFLHTEHNLRRLGPRATATATSDSDAAGSSPRLRFASVPDGLPADHPRAVANLWDLHKSLAAGATTAHYRALLGESPSLTSGSSSAGDAADVFPPVTCVVADGLLSWALDTAEELCIPAIAFRTVSACSVLAYLSAPKLFELGELPFPFPPGGGADGDDLDEPVRGVPGMSSFLRRRDLPSSFRRPNTPNVDDVDPALHVLAELSARSSRARALVLNTAASLERPALAHIAPHVRDLFAVGPLHAMSPSSSSSSSSSLWREDDGCLAWLDAQTADRSVVYVSLGSLAVVSREQFGELLAGLLAAGFPFLWVLRPDMVEVDEATQNSALREALRLAGDDGNGRARVVAWAPQREVLRHRAVGCFLTHAGWNSALEAAAEGVPTVCWPSFADQQINSRFVAAVWGTGLDIKDACDRAVVESAVREAMESAEIRRAAQAVARRVRRDVAAGGSSAADFERLVRFIRDLSTTAKATEADLCQ